MDDQAIKEAFEDKAFVEKLLALDSPEEVQKVLLDDKGISLELTDIKLIKDALAKEDEGELHEDDLEDVAGGSVVLTALGIASIIGAAVAGSVSLGNKVDSWTRRRW
jgi:hypothetical protein